jgi:DNA-binding GntR family transcriptional regulator
MSGEQVRRKGRRNAYREVFEEIAGQIDSGQLKRGDQLPTYPEMEKRYGISHATATRVVRLLKERGYVEGSTRGTFVHMTRSEWLFQQLADVLNALEEDGQDPQLEVSPNGSWVVGRAGAVNWRPQRSAWVAEIF